MRAWAVVLLLTAACDLPRDPERTLARIRQRGEIRVGVAASDPWIVSSPQSPAQKPVGVEAVLIEGLAARLGVRVVWFWGNVEEHYAALESFELDLMAAGLESRSPWKKRLGFTRPYFTSRLRIGFPAGHSPVRPLEGFRVAVRPAKGIEHLLDAAGATVVRAEDPFITGLPVAAPEWEIQARGYSPHEEILDEQEQVMVVPPGENEWLVEVEEHLLSRSTQVESMLMRRAGR